MQTLIERHGYVYIDGCDHVKLQPVGGKFDIVFQVSGCQLGSSFKTAAQFTGQLTSIAKLASAVETALFVDDWLSTNMAGKAQKGQRPVKPGQNRGKNTAINLLQMARE